MTEYQKYLKSEHWQKLRAKKLKRAGRKCGICGSTDKQLDVHHLNYKNLYDVKTPDLRVMCHDCHFLCHQLHREGKFHFTSTSHFSRWSRIREAIKKHLGLPAGASLVGQQTKVVPLRQTLQLQEQETVPL